jgi:hypothetical protein
MDHSVKNLLVASLISFCSIATSSAQQDSTDVDSLLVKQLEQQMLSSTPAPSPHAAPRSAPTANPDISAIGDFRSSYTSIGKRKVETYLNELELQVASVVDPYARAEFLFSFGKDLNTGELGIELEVATLTSTFLPYQLQATLGKFKPQFGKINILHPHYFSFVDFPRMINNFFDSEGMFMEGVSVSGLVPNPYDFYQELVVEVGRVGSEPNASLVQGETNRLLYMGHLKNFFDLTENATLEIGLSALTGPNKYAFSTTIADLDVTYKWKPVQFNTFRSFTWQTEALLCKTKPNSNENVQTYGAYSFAEYQIAKRTFVGARYDYSAFPGDKSLEDRTTSLLLRFQPTEFQILALEYQHANRSYGADVNQVVFRVIFGIGTHAAHAY